MEQVLFTIPIKNSWFPDGLPIHSFGLILFLCFWVSTTVAGMRARKLGLSPEKMQDLGIVLFLSGIIGARLTYMIQYHVPISKFFNIWEGGIVFYGSAIGGFVGYWIFYFLYLKKLRIPTWQLADALAPAIALGIAIGRVGCLLNGCCYGQVAAEECPRIGFPLLTAPVREVVVNECNYQTTTGFTVRPAGPDDVRSVVTHVESGSNADRAELKIGDKIVEINGRPNGAVLLLTTEKEKSERVADWFRERNMTVEFFEVERPTDRGMKVILPDAAKINEIVVDAQKHLQVLMNTLRIDAFRDMLAKWPKGRHDMELVVERDGQPVKVAFTPRSLGLHPTQVYESISMVLLTLLLLAAYPFRRHDGQIFSLLIFCYAIHRFTNEILRNDTSPVALGLTLSQNISLLMLIAGLGLELWLRKTQAKRI